MVRDAEIGTKNTCLHAVANMKLDQRVEILAKMKPFDARTHYTHTEIDQQIIDSTYWLMNLNTKM